MAKLVATLIVSACVGLGVAGCGPPGPPGPPGRINAVLAKNLPVRGESQEDCDKADAVVLAQCTQWQQYAERVRGNWERHWYATSWRVERGQWPHTSVDFISYERWPTPESGIVLGVPLPVYYRGALIAFCIDTSQRRPTIVAQEQRSRIPPYSKLRRPPRDFYDLGKNSMYEQVMAAVNEYMGDDRGKVLPRGVVEEYDDFYVVEVGNALESVVVTVDKGSYKVRPVEPAYR